jgi:hypothetical protein
MVWIILIVIAAVVAGLVALAWWSSGRAEPIKRYPPHRHMTQSEKNATGYVPQPPNMG